MSIQSISDLTDTPETYSSGPYSLPCTTPWSQSDEIKVDDEQFTILVEDDSTPPAACPTYKVALLVDWLLHDLPALRPRRLLHGELVLEEHHDGVISHVSDSSVTVRYGSSDNEFEVEYPLTQFNGGAELSRGDEIEAVIGLLRVPRSPVTLDSLYSEDEQRALDAAWKQRKGVVGDLKL